VTPRLNERSLSRRFVFSMIVIAGVVVSMILGTAGVGLWTALQQSRSASARTLASSAELVEKGMTRSVESIDVLLASLSYRLADLGGHPALHAEVVRGDAVAGMAQDMMRFAPHVRQIMILDQQGVVLFDSAPSATVGGQIDLAALGLGDQAPRALAGNLQIGLSVAGRFLGQAGVAPVGVSVIPVAYPFQVTMASGQQETFYAVAAINPGFVQDSFDAVVAQDRGGIAEEVILARYDGPILAVRASAALPIEIPKQVPAVLSGAIERAESGRLADILPLSAQFGDLHWQVSSRYPLVVVVGRSEHALLNGWYDDQRVVLVSVPVLLLVVLAMMGGLIWQVIGRGRLQEQVRVLSQALEQGPTAVLITSAQGRIEYVNQAFTEMLGYSRTDVVGETPRLIKSGLMQEGVYRELWDTITKGKVWSGELLNRTKDGHLRWMIAAISGVRGDDGDISHFIAVETDVSEQKRLDQRLNEIQKLVEGLLALPVVLYRINRSGVLTDALGAGLEQLKLTRDALIGRRYDDLFPGFAPQVQQALEGQTVRFEGQSRFAHKTVWLEHLLVFDPARPESPYIKHGLPLSGNGTESDLLLDHEDGAIGIALDVTARRQAEGRLSATIDRLNASNHELEQFAYVASHDLQEPLRIVSSYLSLLKRRYIDQLDEDAQVFIGYAIEGSHRMQSLILDLLQLSRIGTQGRELGPTDLSPVIETALANLDLSIKETQASIIIRDPLPTVLGDGAQLIRLFQNLIGNALKYRHPDRPPVVMIQCRFEGGLWHLIVEDNGLGIGEAFRDRIFLIFQRLQSREDSQGNGIGLAICRKIAERHGGSIWVDGEEGRGSRFHVTLRRQDDMLPPVS